MNVRTYDLYLDDNDREMDVDEQYDMTWLIKQNADNALLCELLGICEFCYRPLHNDICWNCDMPF